MVFSCKELKAKERMLIDPDVVRDAIVDLSDSLAVPFVLTTGLSSPGTSHLVILGAVAELIAGAIFMGIGGEEASEAEGDHYRYLKNQIAARVVRSCSGEMEREFEEVLCPIGVDKSTCRACEEEATPESKTNDVETGLLRWSKDVGLAAFLLKFGQGMEEVPTRRLYISAFTIGMGYLIGGLIPLSSLTSSFLTPKPLSSTHVSSPVVAQVTGATRLLVEGIAAGAAFGIVRALEGAQ
ncbi:hypothetical protein K435DRAFT_822042 [Dendrothele bispora CBS 962.96]|uniref:DUF125-domain-containing protein n=1 Tax=Dendrothele bispora (strain CBS 962.96) TaxID=1314807 RepID=A0A4S8LDS9_DENBC|nr:hypothetical protein K435DRAFT_822042 [Dendrothele bispora CBS 962.96]